VKGPLVPLIWAVLLAVNTTVLLALGGDTLEVLLLAGAAAGAAALAALMALGRRVGEAPDLSAPTMLAAVAVAGLVLGAELGPWLLLISAGALLLALGALVREGRR
jgi:hypothetical protein